MIMIKDENYFDNCATTKPFPETLKVFGEISENEYFNASSLSDESTKVFNKLTDARKTIIHALNGSNGNIIFTASGTEADNLAVRSIKSSAHCNIVSTEGEHPAIYNTLLSLKNKGVEIRYCPLKSDGSLNTDILSEYADGNTAAGVFMHVNNETGGISDIKKAAGIIRNKNPHALLICDGVQAFGKIPVNLDAWDIDIYTVSSHKIHAPKGVGALWAKRNVNLSPLIFGGGQENNLRSGTENTAGICAFAKAVEMLEPVNILHEKYTLYKNQLSTTFSDIPDMIPLCGEAPNIYSVAFKGIKSEVIMHMLENRYGYIVGIGSACSSKHRTNRVIKAAGLPVSYHEGLIRISFSPFNTAESVKGLGQALKNCIINLREK